MSNFKDLIISKPKALTLKQKLGSFFIFFLFWTMFLYFFRSVVILIGWVITVYVIHKRFIHVNSIYDIIIVPIVPYFILFAVMLIIFPLWMIYNQLRFRGVKNKRATEGHRVLHDYRVAEDMNVSHELYDEVISGGTLLVHFDDDANIVSIEDLCKNNVYQRLCGQTSG